MSVVIGDRRYDRRAADTQRRERSGKNKGRYLGMLLRVPEEAIKVHFQRPKEPYQDPRNPNVSYYWKKGAKHYIPKFKKFVECAYSQCLTCAYRNPQDFGFEGVQAKKFLKDCWAKDYYSVCGWIEEWHLIIERESDRKDDQGNTKTYFERVIERQAKQELKAAGYDLKKIELPRVFGKRFYIDISAPAWFNDFTAVFETVERRTKDGGYLFPLHYGCGNCGELVEPITKECLGCGSDEVGIDADKHKAFCASCGTEWELLEHRSKELKKLAETLFECGACKHQGYPIPVMARMDLESGEVTYEAPKGGWPTYDIFDVQMTLRTERSKDGAPPHLVIDDWAIQPPDPRLFDPKFQGGQGDENAEEMANKHREPLNLNKVHAPDSPADQARILKLDNLFSSKVASVSKRTVRYGAKQTEDEQDEPEEDTDE